MLKTAGHVKKHYKACCPIFEAFCKQKGGLVTFEDFLTEVEGWTQNLKEEDKDTFRGDMLEILAEMFFGAFANDPACGLKDYTPIPLPEDYGVDGVGYNAAGTKCAVQVKYRGDPNNSVTYAEIARTFTSGVLQLGLSLYGGSDNIFIFTSAYGVTGACSTVMGDKIHVLSREVVKGKIDCNVTFWQHCYDEVRDTLLPKIST